VDQLLKNRKEETSGERNELTSQENKHTLKLISDMGVPRISSAMDAFRPSTVQVDVKEI